MDSSPRTLGGRDLAKGLCLAPVVIWVAWGTWLGAGEAPVTQAQLYWAFSAASLVGAGGAAAGLLALWRRSLPRALGYVALLALTWRLGYFPILVFSGVAASGVDWIAPGAGLGMGAIYASFLCFVYAFHFAVAVILFLATRPAPEEPPTGLARLLDRRLLLAAVIPNLLVAAGVSVIKTEDDLTLLPDRPHAAASLKVPAVHPPERNPYLHRVTEEGATIQERILAFNAGVTYEIIPPGRWGKAVKGTLEYLTFQNPQGSAADRVLEHHLAYLAADVMVRAAK